MDIFFKQSIKSILLTIMWVCLFCLPASTFAANEQSVTLKIGIVPQQKPKKIRKLWSPFLKQLEKETGFKVELIGSPNISIFHSRMMAGKFDIVYTNPMSYINAHERAGFEAIAKEKDKKLVSILVVNKNSKVKDIDGLEGGHLVFPKNAFAATTLTQRYLKKDHVNVNSRYMHSHDEGYSLVALNKFDAAGGVMRTYNVLPTGVRERLKVLVKFDGVTPHAFAIHPRVNKKHVLAVQNALIKLSDSKAGRDALKLLHLKPLERAQDEDWNDVRRLMSK